MSKPISVGAAIWLLSLLAVFGTAAMLDQPVYPASTLALAE